MTNYKPLIYPIIVIAVIGVFFQLLIPFFEVVEANPESEIFPIVNLVIQALESPPFSLFGLGITIPIVNWELKIPMMNIFAFEFLGLNVIGQFIIDNLIFLTILPDIVALPIIAIIIVSLGYGFVKLILP